MTPPSHCPCSTLLVVEDSADILNSLKKRLDAHFERIIDVPSPIEATAILETRPVTHLVCDLLPGFDCDPDTLNAFAFATFAKREFPTLERLVVFTASDTGDLPLPTEVDAVVSRTAVSDNLITALTAPSRPRLRKPTDIPDR